jgi:hypothetical protein
VVAIKISKLWRIPCDGNECAERDKKKEEEIIFLSI